MTQMNVHFKCGWMVCIWVMYVFSFLFFFLSGEQNILQVPNHIMAPLKGKLVTPALSLYYRDDRYDSSVSNFSIYFIIYFNNEHLFIKVKSF
jgi:hypothetical protein